MKYSQNAFKALRLTESTLKLVHCISEICEVEKIHINGGSVDSSMILRYPFEKIAHTKNKEDKINMLTDLLIFAHKPSDKNGNALSKDEVMIMVKKVFEK
jgi:hypothetical protein